MDASTGRWFRAGLLAAGLLALAALWVPLSVTPSANTSPQRTVTRHGLLVWMEEAVTVPSAGPVVRAAKVHGPCLVATLVLTLIVGWYAVARPARELARERRPRVPPVRPDRPRYDSPVVAGP